MQIHEIKDVQVTEPRWSWYGSPLRNCPAVRVTFLEWSQGIIPPGAGTFSRSDMHTHLAEYYLYFTQEEYVMWKLHGFDQQHHDITELRKGTVYA